MDQKHYTILMQVVFRRRGFVEYFIDVLHLEKVIPRSQRTQLWRTTLLGTFADGVGIGPSDTTSLFGVIEIGFRTDVAFNRPLRTFFQDAVHICSRRTYPAGLT